MTLASDSTAGEDAWPDNPDVVARELSSRHRARKWPRAATPPRLQPGAVHIWRIDLVQPAQVMAQRRRLLSPDETARADRFYFVRDRNRFLVARGAVRQLLAEYLGVDPRSLSFTYSEYGKPRLAQEFGSAGLEFNLSHSGEYALLAVNLQQELGVDIEIVRHDLSHLEIAEHYFSPSEKAKLRTVPEKTRAETFFNCWTRKEAYIKARGEGLTLALDSFDVSLLSDERPALLRVSPDSRELDRWRLYALHPAPGYRAALVVRGQAHHLRCWVSNCDKPDVRF